MTEIGFAGEISPAISMGDREEESIQHLRIMIITANPAFLFEMMYSSVCSFTQHADMGGGIRGEGESA